MSRSRRMAAAVSSLAVAATGLQALQGGGVAVLDPVASPEPGDQDQGRRDQNPGSSPSPSPSPSQTSTENPEECAGLGPFPEDFVDIRQVPPRRLDNARFGRGGSRGTFVTDAFSTDESPAAAGTTCRLGDKSPLTARSVQLQFRGNANGPANARAAWSCTGFQNRIATDKYPLCPRGSQVLRILDFPSFWDGQNTDSANHRTHVVFPGQNGACPQGTRAIPQLRMTRAYSVPQGPSFALDSFPEEKHNPITDHAGFANVMPDRLMRFVVGCINRGRRC